MPDKHDLPPGLARAYERGAVENDITPEPEVVVRSAMAKWAAKNLTLTNVLMVLVLLFQGGQQLERWTLGQQSANSDFARRIGALEIRLQAAENKVASDEGTNAATYMRQDVVNAVLKSMDQRLTNIEQLLREQKGR